MRSPSTLLRTIDGVNTSPATVSRPPSVLLSNVELGFICGETHPNFSTNAASHDVHGDSDAGSDIDEILLDTASRISVKLRVIRRLSLTRADAQSAVEHVIGWSNGLGVCSPGAIGVSAMLAEQVGNQNELQLATTLNAARSSFSEDDLLNGAAALGAACSVLLADRLALDATSVHFETHQISSGPVVDRGHGSPSVT